MARNGTGADKPARLQDFAVARPPRSASVVDFVGVRAGCPFAVQQDFPAGADNFDNVARRQSSVLRYDLTFKYGNGFAFMKSFVGKQPLFSRNQQGLRDVSVRILVQEHPNIAFDYGT